MGMNQQLVKNRRIQTKLVDFFFEVFNVDRTKNGEVTRMAPLEIEINRHKKQINVVVMDLNGTDIFLGHDWLVKYNPEVNWKKSEIQFLNIQNYVRQSIKTLGLKLEEHR